MRSASGTVKLGAEWAPGGAFHQSLVTDKGSPAVTVSPSPPPGPPCCSYFSGRPSSSDSESFLSLDGSAAAGSLSGVCSPALELARGDASLGSHTSSCAHWVLTCCSPVQTVCTVCMCVQANAGVSVCLHVCNACVRVCTIIVLDRAEELGGAGCPWTAFTWCKECDWLSGLPIISASGERLQGWKQKLVSSKNLLHPAVHWPGPGVGS